MFVSGTRSEVWEFQPMRLDLPIVRQGLRQAGIGFSALKIYDSYEKIKNTFCSEFFKDQEKIFENLQNNEGFLLSPPTQVVCISTGTTLVLQQI